MATRRRQSLKVIHRVEEIPTFRSEAEEAEFWATHSLGAEILAQAEPIPEGELPPPRQVSRTRPVSVRFDEATLARLRALARKKNKGYQSLLKEFVIERLYEEEKREGIVSVHTQELEPEKLLARQSAAASAVLMRLMESKQDINGELPVEIQDVMPILMRLIDMHRAYQNLNFVEISRLGRWIDELTSRQRELEDPVNTQPHS
jgi:hypothetical protein